MATDAKQAGTMGGAETRDGAEVRGGAEARRPVEVRRQQTGSGLSAPAAAGLLGLMAAVVVAYVATAPVTRASANVATPASEGSGAVPALQASTPQADASAPAVGASAPAAVAPPSTAPAITAATAAVAPDAVAASDPEAPTPALSPAPGGAAPVVAAVGDSLAFSAAARLATAFELAGFTLRSDVAPGRQIPVPGLEGEISSGLDAIGGLHAGDPPALWIVQLGTNDVYFEPTDGHRYVELIDSVLDAIGPGPPVVWVDVWRADRPEASRLFDDVLEIMAAQRPQLHVARWEPVARLEPVLRADGVHLNEFGLQRFTRTMVDAAIVVHTATASAPEVT